MSVSSINRNILLFLKQINHLEAKQMDAVIVTAFQEYNQFESADYIFPILSETLSAYTQQLLTKWNKYQDAFDLENLVELFEYVVSPAEKEVNGAVYTPICIREYIVNEILNKLQGTDIHNVVIGDLSCGCGGFLITLAQKIHQQYGLTYDWIFSHNIVGVDVALYSVERTKIMLKLLALLEGEIVNDNIYVFCQNSLTYDFQEIDIVRIRNGFDAIVGNPPYVSAAKMSIETKSLIAAFETATSGKADLYIPFFQLAIEALRDNGILGYITVNNFYRSVNGRALRQWFAHNKYYIKLIDFGGEQIFKSRSTYTCLCFVRRKHDGYIDYIKSNKKHLAKIVDEDYTAISYAQLNHKKGWLLAKNQIVQIIEQIENCGKPLGEQYHIVNGFATLSNKTYVFTPVEDDENTYTLSCKYGRFKVEKSICRDVIKPNILQSEKDIKKYLQKAIYPYRIVNGKVSLIPEMELQCNYPLVYQYLLACKNDLEKRDKGKREYAAWYEYGRSQALNTLGYKLLFPYIAEHPRFILCKRKDLLFYNGYAICSDNLEDLKFLQKVLCTDLFWKYICATSKPYNNGYYALAKNYVKYFGIPKFTDEQKEYIVNESDVKKCETYIKQIYINHMKEIP